MHKWINPRGHGIAVLYSGARLLGGGLIDDHVRELPAQVFSEVRPAPSR